jgi:acyl carrier protein
MLSPGSLYDSLMAEYVSWDFEAMTVVLGTLTPEEGALARLIIDTLNLDLDLDDLRPETPLYREGMGLDSIDILEVALAVSQRYRVTLHADDENNKVIFSSIRSLSDYIQERKG